MECGYKTNLEEATDEKKKDPFQGGDSEGKMGERIAEAVAGQMGGERIGREEMRWLGETKLGHTDWDNERTWKAPSPFQTATSTRLARSSH